MNTKIITINTVLALLRELIRRLWAPKYIFPLHKKDEALRNTIPFTSYQLGDDNATILCMVYSLWHLFMLLTTMLCGLMLVYLTYVMLEGFLLVVFDLFVLVVAYMV